jgi:hypothetical protein
MQIHKDHAAREARDAVGDTFFEVFLFFFTAAPFEQRLNVALDDVRHARRGRMWCRGVVKI